MPPKKSDKKFATISDLNKSRDRDDSPHHHDDQDFFTGGEKSGLAVQNPNHPGSNSGAPGSSAGPRSANDLVQQILRHAHENRGRPGGGESDDEDAPQAQRGPVFLGRGRALNAEAEEEEEEEKPGDEETDLYDQLLPGRRLPAATRELTFWRNGFSIGDGPLYSYEDPESVSVLRSIEQGTAPLSVLNVLAGQRVDVNVTRKVDQDYVAPKPKPGGYHGAGRRLGTPVPGEIASGSASPILSGSGSATPGLSSAAATATTSDKGKLPDEGEGDATVQLRLCDGSRHKIKFQSAGPVEQLYSFVESEVARSGSNSEGREWVLQTTFPNKELTDKAQTLKEAGVVGAVVVQKWKV